MPLPGILPVSESSASREDRAVGARRAPTGDSCSVALAVDLDSALLASSNPAALEVLSCEVGFERSPCAKEGVER
eukprot:CAMPEP_0117676900 /NCGR_PEP_ID=MMETSP0804-20121206/16455_1 /TAXON_ID=1074897 /ORGANISM="Tetraselmis astigmatica, Strain CCMP880" /LENGTH=74 /DNA_ID=CAMNT_0005486141 /DNA_START=72 /DNA_END=293 /DNA_ORIENTATION=+